MSTNLRTAAQQALELLQSAHVATALVWPKHDCVEALKAALEQKAECDGGTCGLGGYCDGCPKRQPEQEPVAWMYVGIKHDGTTHGPHLVWKPEHMDAMSAEKGVKAVPLYAALKGGRQSAPSPEQPEKEPVACPHRDEPRGCYRVRCQLGRKCVEPLYTHPPRREWRGLTEEEISAVFPSHLRGDYKDLIPYSFARAIEAALKERNHD